MIIDIKKTIKDDRGSIMVYTMLVLITMLTISFAVLKILIPKIKIGAQAVNSTVALYAADSAIEWCLMSNRDWVDQPNTPPQPSLSQVSGASYILKQGIGVTTCPSGGVIDYRAVGTYKGVSRALCISEGGTGDDCNDD